MIKRYYVPWREGGLLFTTGQRGMVREEEKEILFDPGPRG